MSMAGKTRLSERRRSRLISMLPVPLNSSKMTSSMRLPVSMSAVAMIVSEPPSSTWRAAAKKRRGRCRALASIPPERTLPEGGVTALEARGRRGGGAAGGRGGEAGDGVEEDDDVALVLDETLGLLKNHFRDLNVALRRFVEGGADDFALDVALHVGDFFGTLVNEEDDEGDFGMVGGDG